MNRFSAFDPASTEAAPAPQAGHDIFSRLAFGSVALLGWQFPVGDLAMRIAPSDLLVALATVAGLTQVRLRRGSVLAAVAFFPMVMAFGLTVAGVSADGVTAAAFARAVGAWLLVVSVVVWQGAARRLEDGMVRLIRAFVVGSLVVTTIALIEAKILGTAVLSVQGVPERFAGAMYDPNHFGALVAVCAVLSFVLRKQLFGDHAAGAAIVIAGHVVFLALSLSRGAWVAFIAGAVVVVFLNGSFRIDPKVVGAGVVLVVALVLSGAVQAVLDDFASRPDTVGIRETLIRQALTDAR